MSRFISATPRSIFLFACLVLSGTVAHAQFRASLRGTVTTTQGAAVPGAQ